MYMNLFFQDPCVGNLSYIQQLMGNFSVVCANMLELQSNFTNEHETITNIDPMIECCGINYPYESLKSYMPDASQQESYESFGFLLDTTDDNICGGADTCFVPDINGTFAGIMTTCEDNHYVKTELLNLLDNTASIDWWSIWISTGLLASIVLKGCVANFGIALVQLADPFMACDGKYVGPPKDFSFGQKEMNNLIVKSEHLLRIVAVGKVFFWGVFVNLTILNVVLGTERKGGEFDDEVDPAKQKKDALIGAFLIFVSLFPIAISYYAYHLVQQKYIVLIDNADSASTLNDDDEDEDESSSYCSSSMSSSSLYETDIDIEACEPSDDDERSVVEKN